VNANRTLATVVPMRPSRIRSSRGIRILYRDWLLRWWVAEALFASWKRPCIPIATPRTRL